MLILHHPEVAFRDCRDCQTWLYEESGALCVRPGTDEPIRRPPATSTPCRVKGKGCPKGTPEAQRSLDPQNQKCYRHYLECKATGRFPDDPLVTRHAGLIRGLEELAERFQRERLTQLLMASLGLG